MNDRYIGGYGVISDDVKTYEAENLPFTALFTANENGVIDIVSSSKL